MFERNVTLYVKIRIPGDTTPAQVRSEVEDVLFAMGGIGVDEVGIASYVLPEYDDTTPAPMGHMRREAARRLGLLHDIEEK